LFTVVPVTPGAICSAFISCVFIKSCANNSMNSCHFNLWDCHADSLPLRRFWFHTASFGARLES
jgi:hypothetical protein